MEWRGLPNWLVMSFSINVIRWFKTIKLNSIFFDLSIRAIGVHVRIHEVEESILRIFMSTIYLFDRIFWVSIQVPFGGIDLFTYKKKGWVSYFWSILMIRCLIALQTSIIFWSWAILNLQCLRSGRALHLGCFSTIQITVFLFLLYWGWVLGLVILENLDSFLDGIILES